MQNSKLIQLLQTFSSKELRGFRDFIASPYFNKNEELTPFYNYLKECSPDFPEEKIQREAVYAAVFPGKPFDEKHLSYLMSFLLKLGEQFIGQQRYESETILQDYHILDSMIERGLDKHYNHLFSKTRKKLSSYPYRDTTYYFYKYLLEEIANRHFGRQKVRKYNKELQEAANAFDLYYLARKLSYTCEMLNMQKFLSADYQQHLIDEISHYLQQGKHDDIPAIAIYYQIFLTLTDEENETHFLRLKELLQTHVDAFSHFEMKGMYLHAINFCIRQMRKQKETYVQEALDLYLSGIERRILIDDGYLSPWTYKNIMKLGLRLNKYEWVASFIEDYTSYLHPKVRENAVNYSQADLYFHRQDVEKAMDHLRKVEFSDIFFTLDAKIMLLKIYFDQEEEEPLYSLISSFRVFLRRNKLISDSVRKTYLNFILLLNKIIRTRPGERPVLEAQIDQTELLTDRTWLKEVVRRH